MKKVLYVFSFALTLILFSAFTPTETTTTNLENLEIISSEIMVGTGKIMGCYTATRPGNVEFRLEEQFGAGEYTEDADCQSKFPVLDMGEWNLYVSSDVPANFIIKLNYCGMPTITLTGYHSGVGGEIYVDDFYISC